MTTESTAEPLRAVRDLAGAHVFDADGHFVGDLWGSLMEVESGLIRYLDISLEAAPRHVLVPIGHTRVDRKRGSPEVQLRAATRAILEDIPPYEESLGVCAIDEDGLLSAHGRAFCGERYYAHPAFDHQRLFVGAHPVLRSATPAGTRSALCRMADAPEFTLAEGETDVRGWMVLDSAGQSIGRVLDLVLNTQNESAPYVLLDTESGEQRILPTGYVEREATALRAPGLTVEDVVALPSWDVSELTRAREEALRDSIEQRLGGTRRFARADYYAQAA